MATELREKLEETALGYAGRGWFVFPLHSVEGGVCTCRKGDCPSPGKHPRTPSGFKDATTDEEMIRAWWVRWPQANVGIATGRSSGFFVVDVDPKNGGTLESLGELPRTTRVRTGSGGWHLYFRYPDGASITTSKGNLPQGVDVRGEGGYVVAPGSLHKSGQRYEWDVEAEIAVLPQRLLDLMTAKKRAEKPKATGTAAVPRGSWLERAVSKVVDGGEGRNDTGFWLACQLRDSGMSETEAAEVMAEYQERVGELGDHEYTIDEARANLNQAYSREARQSATRQVSVVELPPEVEFTDTGNAMRLARRYGHVLKYVPQWGWLAYVGGKWNRGADGAAMQLAKACVQCMLAEASECPDGRRMLALTDHASRSFSTHKLAAMLKSAQSEPGIAARIEDFDADPMLFNVLNGTLDLRTGELRPHNQGDMLTKQAHVAYDAGAVAPKFERFLREVFPGDKGAGDEDLIAFVQRAFGYSMTGETREHVYFTCYGTGRNGKSTLIGIMMKIFGDYAKALKAAALMRDPHGRGNGADPELTALVGARFVAAQEPQSGELDTARLKEWTGGDVIQAREMYKSPFQFVPQFKPWLSTNDRPEVTEMTDGIWRRIRIVPFTVSFKGREDTELPAKLGAEASGVLNWLIAGCLSWQRDGLGSASAVRDATREYRENEDPYLDFFESVLVPAEPDAKVLLADAYEAFKTWQRNAGVAYLSEREFPKLAEPRGYRKKRANGKRWLYGCRIASVDSADNGLFPPNFSHETVIGIVTEKDPNIGTIDTAEDAPDWCQNPDEHRHQWEVDAYGTHCLACVPF